MTTYAEMSESASNFYVNASTGNDSNDGLSSSTPKLTLAAVLDLLPEFICHNTTVHIRGQFTDEALSLLGGKVFKDRANLLFDGGEDLTTLASFTATSSTVSTITVTSAGWTVNEHAGKWVKPSGQDEVRQVYSNTSDTLTFFEVFSSSPGAVSCNFVRPTTTIDATSFLMAEVSELSGSGFVTFQRLTFDGDYVIVHQKNTCILAYYGVHFLNANAFNYSPYIEDCLTVHIGKRVHTVDCTAEDPDWKVGCYWGADVGMSILRSNVALTKSVLNEVSLKRCALQCAFGGPVFTGKLTLEECGSTCTTSGMFDSDSTHPIRIEDGIFAKKSILSISGDMEVNCTDSSSVVLEDSTLSVDGEVSGDADEFGMLVYNGSKMFYASSDPPTVSGSLGDISIDNESETSTWYAISNGRPLVETNTDLVLIKCD